MKKFFFGLLLCHLAHASDYTLIQLENKNYRDYSQGELKERLGKASELLIHYKCNEINEFDTFWPSLRKNNLANSLRIQLSNGADEVIYREGKIFKKTGEIFYLNDDEFVLEVSRSLKKIEKINDGKILLRELERSYYPLRIVQGANQFIPQIQGSTNYYGIFQATVVSIFTYGRMTSEDVPFHDIGSGGNISWSPSASREPPHVTLSHELYHAFDAIRGILDTRLVRGNTYEPVSLSEYRAIYFENLIRKATKIGERTHYGSKTSGPGILDENNKARKMPSPCLK